MPTKTKIKSASPKRLAWFAAYTDRSNPTTFLNATKAAMAVYSNRKKDQTEQQRYSSCGVIGHENLKILKKEINAWMDEVGLSPEYLKGRLLELTRAKKTKFFADKGKIIDTVVVDDNATQIKAIDMGFKHRGLYAAEKHDVSLTGLESIIEEIQNRNQGGNGDGHEH